MRYYYIMKSKFNPTHRELYSYPKFWAECLGPAPFLPTSREEMDQLGWDSCDIIIVTGDAYVDHPSFGMAIIGRLLESQGFRVGIIPQPLHTDVSSFKALGRPNFFFGITAGNMDSMINHYTADKKIRRDDAYSPNGEAKLRPDRASIIYSQRCREAFKNIPIVLGGIEASLRRIAHYDYWQDKVRRSILVDAKADILLYGNAERAIVEIAHHFSQNKPLADLISLRGLAFVTKEVPKDFFIIDSTQIDKPGRVEPPKSPYQYNQDEPEDTSCTPDTPSDTPSDTQVLVFKPNQLERSKTVIRLPSFKHVAQDPVLYAHANRILHLETNPGNARALMQKQDNQLLHIEK